MKSEITEITKELRRTYYKAALSEPVPDIPSGGSLLESTGNFPSFYLIGSPCCRSEAGLCSPCFYARYPESGFSRDEITMAMSRQCQYVLDNFEELVLNKQYGKVDITDKSLKHKDREPIALTISPGGSYFSDCDFPREARVKALRGLVEKIDQHDIDIVLFVEAHATDIITLEKYLRDSEETGLLKKLNTRVVLGFESANEFTRNVLYNKSLDIQKYEKAVSILQSCGLTVGSFVFAGLAPHTDLEAQEDMLESVKYLKGKKVFPTLMFANVQPYTMAEELFLNGSYRLLQPFTVLDTISEVLTCLNENEGSSYWLLPDPVGGPPMPMFNIFFNRMDSISGREANEKMYRLVEKLRIDRDVEEFQEDYRKFREGNAEYTAYLEYVYEEEIRKKDLNARVDDMIEVANENMDRYVKVQRPFLDEQEEATELFMNEGLE